MATFCTTCGTQLEDQARFCANCGAEQPDRSDSPQPPQQTPVAPSSPVFSAPPPAPPQVYPAPTAPLFSTPYSQPGPGGYAAQPSEEKRGFLGLFSFSGRVGRFEFWMTHITAGIISVILGALTDNSENLLLILLAVVAYLALFVIDLATSVKRWHDRDKSGWWYLIVLIPVIGWIWILIENGFLSGTDGPNSYGSPDSGWPF